ncbi:bifunctional proline dehydrogenase/L-glutamate gamma-semialdehyde dehydrogenase PutA [Halopseudomonas aestusnigri]|jgi:RHH-type proline utilization regulon transcriptional repressor/proline dehydrogenase/delta 1-pyrroline-5-carboxylate dehydrogenase|uniref:bifunctional proline dehydrogenase/L-glutamate gamma-semialdehyde dehydrogenase PutA n=1 Tax=Halopseudomonas TaxID=2901189 RepID=UPI001D19567C|nr:bifunctional proline dehydrogenase/L-glutamate gamma-semialdehyde dehydrogenase PutA [Halopseudomonas aestusnigri]MCC4261044.1 bifunctional proline dehydrogenase/L-glutamate gamma-semialdehyde dehydrogenase PutA [Halopseudomonas aestusnigri]MCK5531801.1 bifunctional proline dehydrogenase/L-glutamate gamma-semialdehyde dehydrogenase PutA [Halopseudomonas aestusnigri]MDL2198197.1 bifunctional proline dehydrogenase/L-glutamate gamma-semialdehyde dehydrogenase PutA [Halopseudomonas aestusnigri]|tara:strand:- start:7277 stop:10432 length:3156 start_codon:yes stop_codon:yes gene_type:complete
MFKASEVLQGDFLRSQPTEFLHKVSANYAVDEDSYLRELIELAQDQDLSAITRKASQLIVDVRKRDNAVDSIDALLQQYSLDTQEGIMLMCLAEALLRVPDADTADALIRDKLNAAQWDRHLGQSEHTLVNAAAWGLVMTGKVVNMDQRQDGTPGTVLGRLIKRSGEPVIRAAMMQAMKIMGRQFVLGRTITEALKNGKPQRDQGYTYSFDMLGEAALTRADAEKYFQDYSKAIAALVDDKYKGRSPKPTISIKLSALHPHYETAREEQVLKELGDSVLALVRQARVGDVGITIDAEEADRLELSLKLFERVYRHPDVQGWGNFGLVVQAYSKRALPVLCWLTLVARSQGDRIPVRLVKGAYWDSEIKWSQQAGLSSYPVFTRKEATDVSYLACARYLLSPLTEGHIYPQFATHNAHTVTCILELAGRREFEFQRLHGMGDALYDTVIEQAKCPVRIYAPVGAHKDLLPYLVRRLLENGANSSFVHKLVDPRVPVDSLTTHPVNALKRHASLANPRIPLPPALFGDARRNSRGVNMNILSEWLPLKDELDKWWDARWSGAPLVNGKRLQGEGRPVMCPYELSHQVGEVVWASADQTRSAIDSLSSAFVRWNATPVDERAAILERTADKLEEHMPELMALCTREAGKLLQDGIDEVREAVDFCRFYAMQARQRFATITLPGPTGESNELYLQGRGVFACISPWNFPLAIFLGQVSAALVCGNTVVAKPAEQTSLVAVRCVELMHEAGLPGDVLALLPGDGVQVGSVITSDPRIAGVAFTGSTQTAHVINRALAARNGAIAPMIAETGGQNAMIVDSTALPEQVVNDVVHSAFQSAGQRCSALRVLFVQEDIAERVIELLKGAMAELHVGDPARRDTDVGPVIDADARDGLLKHIREMKQAGRLIAETPVPESLNGHFVAPVAFRLDSINELSEEHFGPVLHVVTWRARDLDKIIDDINATGFGLTLGVHTRNEDTAEHIDARVRIGNVYINRNQIGAVVGVQPFGGQGLSGTGPKAGGPHYLLRFVTERTRTINTTAVGGNASLLSLGDGEP